MGAGAPGELTGVQPTIHIEADVSVPMRDGIRLAADVYRWQTQKRSPALVLRTPYNKSQSRTTNLLIDPGVAAASGYVVVVQDTRGRFRSEGDFVPFVSDAADGYDTIEWVARQPWCDGHVGIYGSSAMGVTALQAAAAAPPHLRAVMACYSGANLHNGFIYGDGAFQLGFALQWALALSANVIDRAESDETRHSDGSRLSAAFEDRWETISQLPLTDLSCFPDQVARVWQEWLEHPAYDALWEKLDVTRHPDLIQVPVLHVTGWYDSFLQSHIDLQASLQSGRANLAVEHRFIAGPWDHRAYLDSASTAGERDFGLEAVSGRPMLTPLLVAWFDKWLKSGRGDGLPNAAVRFFMMGTNTWLQAKSWPPRTRSRSLFVAGGGHANSRLGDGQLAWDLPSDTAVDKFIYDPADPVRNPGGRTHHPAWLPSGVQNQSEVELRSDVLVYTSRALDADVTIAGSVIVDLYASTSAEDTDFVVKLVDVEPNGYCANIAEGLVRARYRQGFSRETWMTQGQVESFRVHLGDVAHAFLTGHLIRLEVSSSNFPKYDRNLNSRVTPALGKVTDLRRAHQRVWHGSGFPTRVVLPVLG